MVFLCSVWAAVEKIYGASAGVMTTRAGKQLGSGFVSNREKVAEGDLLAALEEVSSALAEAGLIWKIEPWKKQEQGDFVFLEGDKARIKLVFRDCMVRSCLFHSGHHQNEALCQMAHGYFTGAVEQLSGGKVNLAVIHAGENACLKELTWEKQV